MYLFSGCLNWRLQDRSRRWQFFRSDKRKRAVFLLQCFVDNQFTCVTSMRKDDKAGNDNAIPVENRRPGNATFFVTENIVLRFCPGAKRRSRDAVMRRPIIAKNQIIPTVEVEIVGTFRLIF